jgi:hypothetical protein
MRGHVFLHPGLCFDVVRLARAEADCLCGFAIGQLAGEDEMGERYFLIGDRRLNWSLWHMAATEFLDFYPLLPKKHTLSAAFLRPLGLFDGLWFWKDRSLPAR